MIGKGYTFAAMAVMAAVTIGLRAVPFVASPLLRRFPLVAKLGRLLPPAIMTLLLVDALYSGAASNPLSAAWAELVSAAVAIGLQLRFRQPLASIFIATALYVALRNYPVFLG